MRAEDPHMTSTPTAPLPSPVATDVRPPGSATVDRFLEAVCAGTGIPTELYAPDAILDATVPGWRMSARGGEAIARQYQGWFADPGSFEELTRLPVDGGQGEVVTYLLTWIEHGVPHAAHHGHLIRFAPDGRIAADTVFCGGRWPAGLLAQMAEANHAG